MLPRVTIKNGLVTFISRLCCEMEVDGLRGDLVLNKTARALAAWNDRVDVTLDDIRAAAELVLPHRRRAVPWSSGPASIHSVSISFSTKKAASRPTTAPAPDCESDESQVFAPALLHAVGRIEVIAPVATAPTPGRRNAAESRQGKYVRATATKQAGGLAVDATVRAAARRGAPVGGQLDVQPADLHYKEREGKTNTADQAVRRRCVRLDGRPAAHGDRQGGGAQHAAKSV